MKAVSYSLGLLACLAPAMAVISAQPSGDQLTFDMYTTTQGSNTDMHFNMSIPASHGWGGIGIGDGMIGALMFIILPDSTNGSTISCRTAQGYVMPQPLTSTNFQVISGKAENGILSAQGLCSGCQTWSSGSGSFSPTSTSQGFIWAVGPGTDGVSGTGQDAQIMQHANMGTFNVDMTQAAIAPSTSSSSGSGSGSGSAGSSTSGGNSGVSSSMTLKQPNLMMVVAHATLLSLAFLFFFPLGVVLLRTPGVGSWQLHAGVQTVAVALTVAGMGVAISMCMGTSYEKFNKGHQGIGLAATSLAIVQWFLGAVHHAAYAKFQRRWAVTWAHIVVGPIAMVLGAINPILGFLLLEDRPAAIGVGVVGLLIWVATFAYAWSMGAKVTKPEGAGMVERGSSHSESEMNREK